jgi:hypothetical protein
MPFVVNVKVERFQLLLTSVLRRQAKPAALTIRLLTWRPKRSPSLTELSSVLSLRLTQITIPKPCI